MTGKVKAQWVVRLPDRLVLLPQPLQAIRVFSTAEVLKYKTYYGTGEWKSRIERQYDANTQNDTVTVEYWVLLLPLDDTIPLEVLCCTVQRATADRILDSLWLSLFTNCGDNTYVDLRELLAADLVTTEQVANTPAAGRFVDLGDGASRRPPVATGSIATAVIPVQQVPIRNIPTEDLTHVSNTGADANPLWIRSARVGSSVGHARSAMLDVADYSGVEMRAAAAAMHTDSSLRRIGLPQPTGNVSVQGGPPQQSSPPGFSPQRAQSMSQAALEQVMQQSTVPNIGRGMDRNADALSPRERDRLQTQLHAAVMRQQAENRNTRGVVLPSGVDYSDYLQPSDFSDVQPVPPSNDAVDRVDLDF